MSKEEITIWSGLVKTYILHKTAFKIYDEMLLNWSWTTTTYPKYMLV